MTTPADYKTPIRNGFYLLIAYAILGNSPVSANTIVAIKFSDTAAVIAADSRVSGPDGQAREYEVCKITVLDDSHIFVASGLSSVSDTPTSFDAHNEARHQFSISRDTDIVSQLWASAMEAKLGKQPTGWIQTIFLPAMEKFRTNNTVINGIFIEVGAYTVSAASTDILYSRNPVGVAFYHNVSKLVKGLDGINFFGTPTGISAATALLRGDTPLSSQWRERIANDALALRKSGIDALAFEIQSALEEVISHQVDPAIGGTVGVIVLEKGRAPRWINKPTVCNR